MSSENEIQNAMFSMKRKEKEDTHMTHTHLEQQQAEQKLSKRIQKIKKLTSSTHIEGESVEVTHLTVPFYRTLV